MLKALPRPAALIDVSVCIVNWNGREMLGDCLESLLRRRYRLDIPASR